jgi:Protein of unknown function (DUF3383)
MANAIMVDWPNIVPAQSYLSFTTVQQVKDYFGSLDSGEVAIATDFFSKNPGGTLFITRDPDGQRPHLLSANLYGMTTAQLQAINGSLSVQFNGFTYTGQVDLSSVSGTIGNAMNEAAPLIAQAFNSHRGVVATAMASFEQHTVTFTGSISKAQLIVNKIISGGPIVVGGTVTGPGIDLPGTNTIIIHDHNAPGFKGGPGAYSMFHSIHGTTSGTFTETYDVMTINSISGTIENGLQVVSPQVTGLAPATGINSNIAGTGTGVGSQWIINNAPAISGSIPIELKPPLLGVYLDKDGPVTGAKNLLFDLSVQGEFGFDNNPSQFNGFVTGTAAAPLGLSEGEADPASQGGVYWSMAKFMNKAINFLTTGGLPVSYSEIYSNDSRLNANLYAWTQTPAGQGYTFESPVPPANVLAAQDLISNAPFDANYITNTRGYQEVNLAVMPVGHGHG